MSTTVPSVRFMPERAWTSCVAGAAVSGLARANYVPFAPQPYPPGMTADEYAALDPGTPPAPLDCFPRYVMWRENRTPDFAGGEQPILWTRSPGWEFRNDCVVPAPPNLQAIVVAPSDPGNCDECFFNCYIQSGSGSYTFLWKIWDENTSEQSPLWTETTQNVTKPNHPTEFGEYKLVINDLVTLQTLTLIGPWEHCGPV